MDETQLSHGVLCVVANTNCNAVIIELAISSKNN